MLAWLYGWLEAFVDWLAGWLADLGKLIANLLGDLVGLIGGLLFWVFSWVFQYFDVILRRIFWHFKDIIVDLFQLLPVPPWLDTLQAKWNAVPWSTISYYAEPFEIDYGLTLILSVTALKFSLRYLPFLGRGFMAPST